MVQKWVLRLSGIALLILIFVAGFGAAVWQLWNWLMPPIFGLHIITFWQAVGLLCLSMLLFGGWRGRPMWRDRARGRWERMTPEEREKFRQGMRERCGNFGAAAPEGKS